MAIQSPRDLFVYDLSCIYCSEQAILNMLPLMEQQCQNPQVKQLLSDHITTTQRQVSRIQECFRFMGVQPLNISCPITDGLHRDFQQFIQQQPGKDVIDLFCLGTASKTEHYEIASYRGLIEKARILGQTQCASTLEDTLREEESMAQQVEQLAGRVGARMIQKTTP